LKRASSSGTEIRVPFQDDGALINPRDESTSPLEGPDGGVMGGFSGFQYATGEETAQTGGASGNGICRLDPTILNWDCGTGSQREAMSAVMVYDPINNRFVLINDFYT
jgi:hypothetical protein